MYDDWVSARVKTMGKGGAQVEPADSAELRQRKTGKEGTVPRRHRVCQLAFSRARCSCFLTSMSVRMVSAWRLERRRDIVSRPPEKILSTATAEPSEKL